MPPMAPDRPWLLPEQDDEDQGQRHQQLHHGDDDKNSVHNGTPSK